jgi:hypothetical protein
VTETPHGLAALLRPQVFFPLLLVVIVLSVLATPHAGDGSSAPRLSSHATGPGGARGLADAAGRLGWQVRRLDVPLSDTLPADAIYAILVPSNSLTEIETGRILALARRGAGVLMLASGGPLRDSLRLASSSRIGALPRAYADSAACAPEPRSLRTIATTMPPLLSSIDFTGPQPDDTAHVVRLTSVRAARGDTTGAPFSAPLAVGVPVGRGRVLVVADPQIYANDVLRVCRWGVGLAAVRTLEWLAAADSGSTRRTLVFDEYHHGYGRHASVMRTVGVWLVQSTPGRTTTQLAVAALVLLAAVAPRAVPPLPQRRVQRRSPLEHVDALADAYERVRASRTTVRLLVQGLRRRHAPTITTRHIPDEQYLSAIAEQHPEVAADALRVRDALSTPVSPATLIEIARSVAQIEQHLR